MSHPYVISAEIKGNFIEIGVDASNYKAGDYIEISGHATQTGGAFANFYAIKEVDDPSISVPVQAQPLPPNQFRASEDVSIVVRVGKVWLTVLGRTWDKREGETAGNGTRWDQLRKWSEVNRSSDAKDGYPSLVGGSSFPANGSSSPAGGSSPPADSSPPA